jgi:hypothetical protein
MQIRQCAWFAAAFLLSLAAVLPGQEPPPPDAPQMQSRFRPRSRSFNFPLSLALDADRDGKLSSTEIEDATAALGKLDANHDGTLSAEEIGWPPRRLGGPNGPGGPAGGPPPFGGVPGEGGRSPVSLAQRLMNRDVNQDGRVTADELPKSMQFLLRQADANGDGAIDQPEAQRFGQRLEPGPQGKK